MSTSVTIYASAGDGYMYAKTADHYSNARDAASASVKETTEEKLRVGLAYVTPGPGDKYRFYRAYLYFDTSSIPANATIISASVSLYLDGLLTIIPVGFDIYLMSGQPTYPSASLSLADFNRIFYPGGGANPAAIIDGASGYKAMTFTAVGLASWINKGGMSKFCVRTSLDIAATLPHFYMLADFYSSEESEVGERRPKLEITYGTKPIVTTDAASGLGPTYATGNGTLNDAGDTAITEYGVIWNDDGSNPVDIASADHKSTGSDLAGGVFTASITGLSPETSYYYRAYATNSAGTTYGDVDVPDPGGEALRLKGTATANGNAYLYVTISREQYLLVSGDILSYDIFISPSSPAFLSGMDITFVDTTALRNAGLSDQNGVSAHPGTDLSSWAEGKWYHREIDLSTLAGKTTDYVDIALEDDVSGAYHTYVANVIIENGGLLKKAFWTEGPPSTTSVHLNSSYTLDEIINTRGGTQFDTTAAAVGFTVTTQDATAIVDTSATCHGTIVEDAGYSITEHGVVYKKDGDPGTPADPTTAEGYTEEGAGAEGAFTSDISGLDGVSIYLCRAYAQTTDDGGHIAYGELVVIRTIEVTETTFDGLAGDGRLFLDIEWTEPGESCADVKATASAGTIDTASDTIVLSTQITRDTIAIYSFLAGRGYLYFDTSAIGSGAVIESVTLRIYVSSHGSSPGTTDPGIHVRDGQPNYPSSAGTTPGLVVGDFDESLYSSIASLAQGDVNVDAYNSIALPTSSVTKTSLTKLCLRLDTECGPSGYGHYLNFYSGNHETYPPKLDVTYYIPASVPDYSPINIGDTWKEVGLVLINIGDTWRYVSETKINVGDDWKDPAS